MADADWRAKYRQDTKGPVLTNAERAASLASGRTGQTAVILEQLLRAQQLREMPPPRELPPLPEPLDAEQTRILSDYFKTNPFK